MEEKGERQTRLSHYSIQNRLFCPTQNVWACRNVCGKISNLIYHYLIDILMIKNELIDVFARIFVVFCRGLYGVPKRFSHNNFLTEKHKSKRKIKRGGVIQVDREGKKT
jgi:hypothetical protein